MGGAVGYDVIVQRLQDATGCTESEAHSLLQLVNRTVSGGTAFDCVNQVFGSDLVILAPDSAAATPLEVLSVHKVALLRAQLAFRVQSESLDGNLATIDAAFLARVESGEVNACVILKAT